MKARVLHHFLTRFSAAVISLITAAQFVVAEQIAQKLAETADSSADLRLRGSIVVDSTGVFLDQLVESPTPLPHLRVCDSPAFGKCLIVKRSDLRALCDAANSDVVLTNCSGSETARISRRSRILGEKELTELVTASLQQQVKDTGQLELRLARPWVPISVPDEKFKLNLSDIPTSGVGPNFIVRLEIETAGGERIGSWQAPVQAKVWRDVWVAHSAIKRGELVRGADVVLERRDILVCREALADLTADEGLLEFSEPLMPGAPVLARAVKPRPIVHRGQSVAAIIHDGPLQISLKVEALEDGSAGQLIRVRNPSSRRDLHAKVIDEQNVQVSL